MSTAYCPPDKIRSIAVIGTGSVGASWAALFLAHGFEVRAHDPSGGAKERAEAFIKAAWSALLALNTTCDTMPPLDQLHFFDTAAQAALGADAVQENTPEKPELKARVLAEISSVTGPDIPILSSTGGIPPSALQEFCLHPERLVVVHPFNPTHLIPLVEVVGGTQTAPDMIAWAMEFSRYLGKQPIQLKGEANGHMTNRLQFALIREAVACLLDGTASAQDIDHAVRYGLGPRWTLIGSLLMVHLAGGTGGTKGILEHAAPAIEEWWTPKSQPKLTDDVIARLVAAGDEVSYGQPIAEWVDWRDRHLVEVLKLQQASEEDVPRASSSVCGEFTRC